MAPPLTGEAFVRSLDAQRGRKYPDPPPFYQDLFDGKVHREILQLWAKNMYSYWDHAMVFSTGAIFVKTNDEPTRTNILRKMVCIEGKDVVNDLVGWTTPAYEELWLRFGEAIGLSRDEITSWKVLTRSHFAMSTLCMLSRWWEWTWLDGVASFYAGDQYGREVLGRASATLRGHYGVPEASLEFFRVYLEDVAADISWEQEALAYWACTTERQLTAARAFRARLDIEYQLVQPLSIAAAGGGMPPQVP